MNEPLGNAVGNALEIVEAVQVLKGHGPAKLVDVMLTLCDEILMQSGVAHTREDARSMAMEAIASGIALARFADIVKAQGGDPAFIDRPELLPQAAVTRPAYAPCGGFVTNIDARGIGLAAMHLGAGRRTKEDVIDLAVGLVLDVKTGDAVSDGDRIATVYARTDDDAATCEQEILRAVVVGQTPVSRWQTVVAKVSRADGVVTYEQS
jgi:thymidine phosphorylase